MLELDDVLMIHGLEQFCLLLEQLDTFFLQSLALDHFNCNLLAGLFVYGTVNGAEGTLAEDALKFIVI